MKQTKGKKIKVLSIGNSFSGNAQTYLYDIAKADGVDMIAANLHISNCALEMHCKNASSDEAVYNYYKSGEETKKGSLKDALTDEEWDYVTFQQRSGYSGLIDTYFPHLTDLLVYVKGLAPSAEPIMHQTWAYAKGCEWVEFGNYDFDQQKMFNALKDTYKKAADKAGIKVILPVGEAIQMARESEIGDNLSCDDKTHIDANGCFLASCVWYEVLTGNNVKNNSFIPEEVPFEQIPILKKFAHEAVMMYK